MKKISIFVWILIAMVVISLVINVKNQFLTLKTAKDKNVELAEEIRKTDELNKNLIKKIEYSTGSAFVNQKAREYFGLGKDKDVWLILSPERKVQIDFVKKEENVAKFDEWLKLFTR